MWVMDHHVRRRWCVFSLPFSFFGVPRVLSQTLSQTFRNSSTTICALNSSRLEMFLQWWKHLFILCRGPLGGGFCFLTLSHCPQPHQQLTLVPLLTRLKRPSSTLRSLLVSAVPPRLAVLVIFGQHTLFAVFPMSCGGRKVGNIHRETDHSSLGDRAF